MNADVVGAVFLIAVAAGLVAAHLIHQARTNARHRAVPPSHARRTPRPVDRGRRLRTLGQRTRIRAPRIEGDW